MALESSSRAIEDIANGRPTSDAQEQDNGRILRAGHRRVKAILCSSAHLIGFASRLLLERPNTTRKPTFDFITKGRGRFRPHSGRGAGWRAVVYAFTRSRL